MFSKLTHELLRELEGKGYNCLKSTSHWGDESPTYTPIKVDNVNEYLMWGDLHGQLGDNPHFLVISEALTIPEEQLFGFVLDD
ncbi:MAG TPA: hypothetical protein VNQ80_12335 [Parapedobacter sp.]|uniref:hypothetical protein n=1 Tax=Parapedobacter sp. TaxID=1958893 RepID=UPI002D0D6100|nr:hypothetical protein [Parapedobacter sp.]HWK58125.1 hypothetical protein [Parapedobacter sp.]